MVERPAERIQPAVFRCCIIVRKRDDVGGRLAEGAVARGIQSRRVFPDVGDVRMSASNLLCCIGDRTIVDDEHGVLTGGQAGDGPQRAGEVVRALTSADRDGGRWQRQRPGSRPPHLAFQPLAAQRRERRGEAFT